MILYHATPRKHLASIEAEGLDPMKSAGKRKEVYLHTASKRMGCSPHRGHGLFCTPSDDTKRTTSFVIKVNSSPHRHLTRRWSGLWSCSAVPITEVSRLSSTLTNSRNHPSRKDRSMYWHIITKWLKCPKCLKVLQVRKFRTTQGADTPEDKLLQDRANREPYQQPIHRSRIPYLPEM